MSNNKNIATNSLAYTGIVTLSQYKGNKKLKLIQIHNSGKNPLFTFLSDCLAGNFDTAKLNMPNKIKLLCKSEKDSIITFDSCSIGYTSLFSIPEKDASATGSSAVIYSFVIPYDQITDTFNCIALYTANPKGIEDFAAICDTGDEVSLNNLPLNSSLVIDWKLIISNAASSPEITEGTIVEVNI